MTSRGYALGLGCERGCAPEEVSALARKVLEQAGIAAKDLKGVYSIDQRAGEPALVLAAHGLGLRLECFGAQLLEEQTPRLLNPSERVFALMGCHGVAEAAALVGAGPDSILLVGKTKSAHATAALAAKN
ncbi:cobalamin biosynthesis protein [Phyllobacterium sp. BT25]|uniref:Cobalamin biosynthesis protein n=1 Tax=Phyllobacterium pellucidum TaxID=2740464 RepID=A0A849VQ75_9HYPH|nr:MULTISPECIES: cobalamin biosynthesis protein [Phyllobacterium]NTS31636.1 cobalamin biosynthesis protein [Phyllobacterium pellucidum]UGY09099.1 cobalamin biosynthesis protein [Phyllobacterium sp. T1018]